jgi:hypothetical protein
MRGLELKGAIRMDSAARTAANWFDLVSVRLLANDELHEEESNRIQAGCWDRQEAVVL